MITDEQTLEGAKFTHGTPIPVYDDGYGPLWIHRNSMGISGIVRAQTWEDAYSICEDEFFTPADDDAREEMERIENMEDGPDKEHAQACFDESYGFRPNGNRRMPDGTLSSIYAKDLNGESLDRLTPAFLEAAGIVLDIRDPEPEPEPPARWHLWHLQRVRTPRGYVVAWSGRYGTRGSRIYPPRSRRFMAMNEHVSPTWEG